MFSDMNPDWMRLQTKSEPGASVNRRGTGVLPGWTLQGEPSDRH